MAEPPEADSGPSSGAPTPDLPPHQMPPTPAHGPLADLLRWALSRGASFPSLALVPDDPRAFAAAAPIEPRQSIITLPQSLLMHAGTALSDPVYGPAFRQLRREMRTSSVVGSGGGGTPASAGAADGAAAAAEALPSTYWDSSHALTDRDVLCMLLILERCRGSRSAWAPYIQILPESYDDPAFWAEGGAAEALVRGTRLARGVAAYRPGLQRLAKAMKRLREIHSDLHAKEPSGGAADAEESVLGGWSESEEAARWARSAVWSRSFTVRRLAAAAATAASAEAGAEAVAGAAAAGAAAAGEERARPLTVCQVPVLDMIDHRDGCVAAWHTGPEGADDFTWLKMDAVAQGEILANNYGSKDNQELLLAYGFVVQPNRHDYVSLSVASSAAAPTAAAAGAMDVDVTATGGASGGPDEDEATGEGEEDEAASVQAAAEAAQRRLVAAAAGLPTELRLTLATPLPEALMQTTRLALASGPRLYFAADEALAPPASSAADPSSSSGVPTSPPSSAPAPSAVAALLGPADPALELRALGAVASQLRSRLGALVESEAAARVLLGLGPAAADADGCAVAGGAARGGAVRQGLLVLPDWWLDGVEGTDSGPTSGPGPGPGGPVWGQEPAGHKAGEVKGESGGGDQGESDGASAAAERRLSHLGSWLAATEAAAAAAGVGRHEWLALAVVNGQRAILTAALREAGQRMAALLQDASTGSRGPQLCAPALMSKLSSVPTAAHANGDDGSSGERSIALRMIEVPPSSSSSASSAATAGFGTAPPLPYRAAIHVRHAVASGEEALRLPLGSCLATQQPPLLPALLALAAHQRWAAWSERCTPSDAPSDASAPGPSASAGPPATADLGAGLLTPPEAALLDQLLVHVPPAPVVRLMLPAGCAPPLPPGAGAGAGAAGRGGAAQCLLPLLEDSPVNAELEQQAGELQDDFNSFRQSLPSVLGHLGPRPCGGPARSTCALRAAAQAFLSAPPQQAFWLYGWAREAAERCAVEVAVEAAMAPGAAEVPGAVEAEAPAEARAPAAAAADAEGGGKATVLAPVLWCLPEEVRSAALRCSIRGPGTGAPGPEPSLVVAAACPLPSGLLLHPGCLLLTPPRPGASSSASASASLTCDADALLVRYGPDALAAAAAAAVKSSAAAAGSGAGGVSPETAAAAAAALAGSEGGPEATAEVAMAAAELGAEAGPFRSLELLPGPGEGGRGGRLTLMRGCGLGCVHYLGPGGRGSSLLTAALRLLLLSDRGTGAVGGLDGLLRAADPDNSVSDGASGGGGGGGPGRDAGGDTPGAPGPDGAGVSGAAPMASGLGAAGGVELGRARRVVAHLLALPHDGACAKGARKMLRSELMGARKQLRGRLKRLPQPGSAGPAAEGVRLYLGMYDSTLGAWCKDLGLGAMEGEGGGGPSANGPAGGKKEGSKGEKKGGKAAGKRGAPEGGQGGSGDEAGEGGPSGKGSKKAKGKSDKTGQGKRSRG